MIRWVIALVFLGLVGCAPQQHSLPKTSVATTVAKPEASRAPAAVAHARFDWNMVVDGRRVRVHVVAPNTPPPWPTVMLLHGASGLGRGFMVWPVANALAERGVAAAVVRYFDAMPASVKRKGAIPYFQLRERQLSNMVDQLLVRPEVMGPELAVYGYSLGAFHGLGMAATDPRIAAVVALAGGLPRNVPASAVERAAPVMLVHGTRDRIVPYARTREAEAVWRHYGRPVSVMKLKNTGHVPRPADRKKMANLAADFLAKELQLQVAELP
ncbi:MAG: dienelactone hydrolase family protein [Alphaproteobacteria bacterium]|nr:dienelactone hydrolase family protein [Alphaproteobacteria bacterium]MCB9929161.1 dienelactone hydrolase family protein [Alphaproteobacteria bacterium]